MAKKTMTVKEKPKKELVLTKKIPKPQFKKLFRNFS